MLVVEKNGKAITIKRPGLNDICDAVYALTQLIPVGYVTSYGNIGKMLGVHPRIVAHCLKINRNAVLVPCHRVVYSSRKLGGYSSLGVEFKKKILELEGVVFKNNKVMSKHFLNTLF